MRRFVTRDTTTSFFALCLVQATFAFKAIAQFTTVINIPPDAVPSSVSSNTQINVLVGGTIGNDFEVGQSNGSVTNVELNLDGGTIGERLDVQNGATMNMTSGMSHGTRAEGGGCQSIRWND